jgi:hypothetical protein
MVSSNPMGNLDSATPAWGGFSIGGWAIDPDTTSPVSVDVLIDNVQVQTLSTTTARPDVNAVYPAYPGDRGFTAYVPSSPGAHTVCVRGTNVGPGVTTTIACRTATLTGVPFGNLDQASRSGNSVTVTGWAIDPDTSSPIDVHVYVDGGWGGLTRADRSRPDVGAAFPAYGSNHGYTLTLDVTTGSHQVCIYGINSGPGATNPRLNCATV